MKEEWASVVKGANVGRELKENAFKYTPPLFSLVY
jgi:hypothetical protein